METKIQESLYQMVDADLLTVADLPFAQSWFSDSTWAGAYFLSHEDVMDRLAIVKSARNSEDEKKIKRKLRLGRTMG